MSKNKWQKWASLLIEMKYLDTSKKVDEIGIYRTARTNKSSNFSSPNN